MAEPTALRLHDNQSFPNQLGYGVHQTAVQTMVHLKKPVHVVRNISGTNVPLFGGNICSQDWGLDTRVRLVDATAVQMYWTAPYMLFLVNNVLAPATSNQWQSSA
eukprot:scaffold67026_cov52-Attheya_sp.AAC.1